MRFSVLQEANRHGRGGIHDARQQAARPAQERRTGVMMRVNKLIRLWVHGGRGGIQDSVGE